MIPAGFTLLMLQGISELIKKIAILTGDLPDPGDQGHHHHTAADGEAV